MYSLNALSNNRLLNKHSTKLAWIIAILVLILVLISLSWTVWSQSEIKKKNYADKNITPIQTTTTPTYRVNDIVSANLFGDPTPVPVVVIKEAPKTTLNLTLEGVLWSSDNSVGRAIIQSGKQASELYSIDEEIKGTGAKVEEIRDGEVILNRSGALESLPLKTLIDSSNRIVVDSVGSQPDPEPSEFEEFFRKQNSSDAVLNQQVNIEENKVIGNNDQTQRIRRPNFSGLDRALEKMGEL